jgi:hypothetical protein
VTRIALAISLLMMAVTAPVLAREASLGRGTAPADAGAVQITVKPDATVSSDTGWLGDVAQVSSATSADTDRVEAVALGPAPLPGQVRPISLGYIKMRLRHARLSPTDIDFSGAETVRVRRTAAARVRGTGGAVGVAAERSGLSGAETLVSRGDLVKVVLELQTIRLTAAAQALRSGCAGDLVPVRIQATSKVIEGTVTAHNIVRITLGEGVH